MNKSYYQEERKVEFKKQNKDRHHKTELYKMRDDFNNTNKAKIRRCHKCNNQVTWRVNSQMSKYLADYPSLERHNCQGIVKIYTQKEIQNYMNIVNN